MVRVKGDHVCVCDGEDVQVRRGEGLGCSAGFGEGKGGRMSMYVCVGGRRGGGGEGIMY